MMKFKIPVFIVLAAFLGVSSCKKGDDSPIVRSYTLINFINASADTLNFYVNGSRLNTLSSSYPVSYSGYIRTPLGEQNYEVKKAGNPNSLFNLKIPADSSKIYSFYITDGTLENSFTTTDDLYTLPDSVTSVRFVNTSPKLGGVDVLVSDTLNVADVVNFKGSTFKSTSAFKAITPGVKRIQVFKAGTQEVLSEDVRTLQTRRAYTLFTKAALTPIASKTVGTGLIINK